MLLAGSEKRQPLRCRFSFWQKSNKGNSGPARRIAVKITRGAARKQRSKCPDAGEDGGSSCHLGRRHPRTQVRVGSPVQVGQGIARECWGGPQEKQVKPSKSERGDRESEVKRPGKVTGSLEVHYLNSPSQIISVYQTHTARSRKSGKRGTDRCPRSILVPVGVNSKGGRDSRG